MAKNYNDEDGVWRTIGGRRVFIRNGQSLSEAMKESGKFKNNRRGEKMTRKEKEAEYEMYKKLKEDKDSDKSQVDWEELEQKYGKRYLDDTDPMVGKYGENGERIEKRVSEFRKEANEKSKENQDKIKKMTDDLGIGKERATRDDYNKKNEIKDTRATIKNVAKNSKEDNITLDTETGEAVKFDKGYSVSFQQSTDNYSDKEFDEKVNECKNICNGKLYAGKYGGEAEPSFYTDDLSSAKEIMYKYNQESIYDWETDDYIYNEKYDPSKNKTNFNASEYNKKDSDPYDDPESEESQRLQYIQSRYDDYLQKTEGRGASYGELSYVENLRGKDLDDFEKELDDFEAKEEKKTTNETMNEKIRARGKKEVKDDLPKRVEIKEQGTSNRKEVSENIQAHILDYYDDPQDFIEQMENMDEPTMWKAGEKLAEWGTYEVYYDDQREFLNSLKINPKGKEFSDDRVFQVYNSLIGRESAKLYDRLKKNAFNKYKREHPLSKMTFEEFKNNRD